MSSSKLELSRNRAIQDTRKRGNPTVWLIRKSISPVGFSPVGISDAPVGAYLDACWHRSPVGEILGEPCSPIECCCCSIARRLLSPIACWRKIGALICTTPCEEIGDQIFRRANRPQAGRYEAHSKIQFSPMRKSQGLLSLNSRGVNWHSPAREAGDNLPLRDML